MRGGGVRGGAVCSMRVSWVGVGGGGGCALALTCLFHSVVLQNQSNRSFTGLVLLTLFLQDILSLALPCILIIFSKVVSFSKFPMHC